MSSVFLYQLGVAPDQATISKAKLPSIQIDKTFTDGIAAIRECEYQKGADSLKVFLATEGFAPIEYYDSARLAIVQAYLSLNQYSKAFEIARYAMSSRGSLEIKALLATELWADKYLVNGRRDLNLDLTFNFADVARSIFSAINDRPTQASNAYQKALLECISFRIAFCEICAQHPETSILVAKLQDLVENLTLSKFALSLDRTFVASVHNYIAFCSSALARKCRDDPARYCTHLLNALTTAEVALYFELDKGKEGLTRRVASSLDASIAEACISTSSHAATKLRYPYFLSDSSFISLPKPSALAYRPAIDSVRFGIQKINALYWLLVSEQGGEAIDNCEVLLDYCLKEKRDLLNLWITLSVKVIGKLNNEPQLGEELAAILSLDIGHICEKRGYLIEELARLAYEGYAQQLGEIASYLADNLEPRFNQIHYIFTQAIYKAKEIRETAARIDKISADPMKFVEERFLSADYVAFIRFADKLIDPNQKQALAIEEPILASFTPSHLQQAEIRYLMTQAYHEQGLFSKAIEQLNTLIDPDYTLSGVPQDQIDLLKLRLKLELVALYCKAGMLDDAERVFKEIDKAGTDYACETQFMPYYLYAQASIELLKLGKIGAGEASHYQIQLNKSVRLFDNLTQNIFNSHDTVVSWQFINAAYIELIDLYRLQLERCSDQDQNKAYQNINSLLTQLEQMHRGGMPQDLIRPDLWRGINKSGTDSSEKELRSVHSAAKTIVYLDLKRRERMFRVAAFNTNLPDNETGIILNDLCSILLHLKHINPRFTALLDIFINDYNYKDSSITAKSKAQIDQLRADGYGYLLDQVYKLFDTFLTSYQANCRYELRVTNSGDNLISWKSVSHDNPQVLDRIRLLTKLLSHQSS